MKVSFHVLSKPVGSAKLVESCGFIKGTLIHTKNGCAPVEDIGVGDLVLSSPADESGVPQYKRVLRALIHEHQSIVHLGISTTHAETRDFLAVTGDRPFWVEGKGWTRADRLRKGSLLRAAGGNFGEIVRQKPVYRTEREGVGWVSELRDVETSHGSVFDYANYKLVERRELDKYLLDTVISSEDPYLRVSVYNIHVEDFDTCFAGYGGYLVSNAIRENE